MTEATSYPETATGLPRIVRRPTKVGLSVTDLLEVEFHQVGP
ncbi:hypothetical protein [Jiangella ureilytica]|nr:hypothetical protein [Jiangella ureilytica]